MHTYTLRFLLFVFLFFTPLLSSQIDFDGQVSDFILETRQIVIPEHPHAFNPSIVRWNGKLLLCFRDVVISQARTSFPLDCYESRLGFVWLDDEFRPIGKPSMIEMSFQSHYKMEDARLVTVGNELYIVYSDNIDHIYPGKGCRVFVATIEYLDETFYMFNRECLSQFEGECYHKSEKNWVPFDYFGNLLLTYSINPHQVLLPLSGTNSCETFATSHRHIDWRWGELRGGTPAVLVDGQYLGFFHSSKEMATVYSGNEKSLHYFIGAYTFSADYPFGITKISSNPIFNEELYSSPSYVPYWKPVRVVFPCGVIVDNNDIWVSYGKQDHEMWIVKFDKKMLIESLEPITQ